MRSKRKILSIVLILAMILSYSGSIAFTADGGAVYAASSAGSEEAAETSADSSSDSKATENTNSEGASAAAGSSQDADDSANDAAKSRSGSSDETNMEGSTGSTEADKDDGASGAEDSDEIAGSSDDGVPGAEAEQALLETGTDDEESDNDAEEEPVLVQQTLKAEFEEETLSVKSSGGSGKVTDALGSFCDFWSALTGREPLLAGNESNKLSEAEHTTLPEDLPYEITVSGSFPEGTRAKVTYIDTDEGTNYSETALITFRLTLYDEDGSVFIPEEAVTISVSGAEISEAISGGDSFVVYSYEENDERAEEYNKKYSYVLKKTGEDSFYAADVLVYHDEDGLEALLKTVRSKAETADNSTSGEDSAYAQETSQNTSQISGITDIDDLLLYKVYDEDKTYKDGEDAVRYTEDEDGLSITSDNKLEFTYLCGTSLDPEAEGEDAASEAASFVLASKRLIEDTGSGNSGSSVKAGGSDDGASDENVSSDDANASGNDAADSAAGDGDKEDKESGDNSDAAAGGEGMTGADAASDNKKTAVTLEATDGETYKVTVTCPESAGIPDGTKLVVTPLTSDNKYFGKYISKAAGSLGIDQDELEYAYALDITLIDPETGDEIQPQDDVSVSIEVSEGSAEDIETGVVHFSENLLTSLIPGIIGRAELMDSTASDDAVEFDASSFSVYVIAGYSVDFHWGSDTYSIPGGGEIFLSELIEALNITDFTLDDVAEVVFSDPSLIQVDEVLILENDPEMIEDDESEEIIDDVREDWRLWSLASFDTEETLTITLNSGEVVEITVTDPTVDAALVSGRRVTADGVTYTLSNAGTGTGTAVVYAISEGCTIHNAVSYKGYEYTVSEIDQTAGNLTKYTTHMDWDLVYRAAAETVITLPDIVTEISDDEEEELADYIAGTNNNSSDQQVWKKAEYDEDTNSITYTLKYFQPMEANVPIDFIFVYDDSASMYSGHRTSNGIVLREAQATRVMILDAAKALLSGKEDYDLKVYLAGASTGDTRTGGPFASYDDVETYLATYNTGTTRHATGVSNALTLAQASKAAGRNPVVVYLSDFHQPGTLGTAGIATCTTLHSIAPVYGLSTDLTPSGNAYRYIPTSTSAPYFRTMTTLDEGIEALQDIIWDAIGYYMDDAITVTDNLSSALSNYSATSTTTSGNGTVTAATGKTTWSLGNQSPLLVAGKVYTETFTVALSSSKVYSGAAATNADASVKVNNSEVNSIPASSSPILQKGITFTLGMINKAGSTTDTVLSGVKFTLTNGTTTKEYTTGSDGSFTVPYSDFQFFAGETYTLTQDQDTSPTSVSDDPRVAIPNPMTWMLTVNSDYTISATKLGADTDMTISDGQFYIWNREYEIPALTKVVVQKNWGENTTGRTQNISFTVYGNTSSGQVQLPAYAENYETAAERASGTKVNTLTSADTYTYTDSNGEEQTVSWAAVVWVPSALDDADITSYTVVEGDLTADTESSTIIGTPGTWTSTSSTSTTENYVLTSAAQEAKTNEVTDNSYTAYLKFTTNFAYGNWGNWGSIQLTNATIEYTYDGSTYSNVVTVESCPHMTNGYTYYLKFNTSVPDITSAAITSISGKLSYWLGLVGPYSRNISATEGWFRNPSFVTSYSSNLITSSPSVERVTSPAKAAVYSLDTAQYPVVTLTNSFDLYNVLTINSEFTDASSDSASTSSITAVKYTVTDADGNEITTPEVTVTGGTAAAQQIYLPTDEIYTVRQDYYRLSDGTSVAADGDGDFAPFKTSLSGSGYTSSGSTASVGDDGGNVIFTNIRKMFPVTVVATWEPDLDLTDAVYTSGIAYALSWGDDSTQQQSGTVKGTDSPAWTNTYTTVPTYSIYGEETECALTSASDPHESYYTEITRDEDETAETLTFTIVNTQKTGTLTIGKEWNLPAGTEDLPSSVTVQVRSSGGTVMADSIVLNDANGWNDSIELPAGVDYIVEETKAGDTAIESTVYTPSYEVSVVTGEGDDVTAIVTSGNTVSSLTTDGAIVTVTNILPICKIVHNNEEIPFTTLRAALTYAETYMSGTATIQMLVDYTMPEDDALESVGSDSSAIQYSDNITLTTADADSGTYRYIGSNTDGIATIIKGEFTSRPMFQVAASTDKTLGGSLTLTNIILDGNGQEYTGSGSIVYLEQKASLTVNSGVSIENGRAQCGGAVYGGAGVNVTIYEGAVFSGNVAAGGDGGAIYLGNNKDESMTSTLSADGATFSNNSCTTNGGAIRTCEATTVTLTDCTFTGNTAAKNAGAVAVLSNVSYVSTLTISGGTYTGNTAGGDGGAARIGGGGTMTVKGDVTMGGSSANANTAANGGALAAAGTIIIKADDTDSTKIPIISYNTAATNGGAAYIESSAKLGITAGSLSCNSAGVSGGAVYVNAGSLTVGGTANISGNTASNADSGAVDGESGAKFCFEGSAVVYGNPASTGDQKNVVLNQDDNTVINTTSAGLSSDAHIGVYVVGDDSTNPYKDHGTIRLPFGTAKTNTEANLGGMNPDGSYYGFTNDRVEGLFGVNASDINIKTGTLIYWGQYIAKITDKDDNLLYQDAGATIPAVYTRLKWNDGAFKALEGNLYKADGTLYSDKIYNVKMLVDRYEATTKVLDATLNGYNITFTTASAIASEENDLYLYRGEAGTNAVIVNKNSDKKNLIVMRDCIQDASLTLTNITLDGNMTYDAATKNFTGDQKITEYGGLVNARRKTSLIINEGTVLQNAYVSSGGGGAVCAWNYLEMNGGTIRNCYANHNDGGGGICIYNSGTFKMTGGTIENCRTSNGGAVSGVGNGKFTMSGGTIQNCTATQSGGGVYFKGTFTMSGGEITGCTAINGGAVYIPDGKTFNISAGELSDNTASSAGAGIYLYNAGAGKKSAVMNIEGNPVFSGNTVTKKGYSTLKNGTEVYGSDYVRQDIYLMNCGGTEEHEPVNIIVTGEITSGDGSIWVWAENEYHYKQLMPFAQWADSVSLDETAQESTMMAFRNARDDDTTENGTDTYLYGTSGDEDLYIYWTGVGGYRKVILRKVAESTYDSLGGAEFTVYKGSSTSAYTLNDSSANTTETLEDLESGDSGVFWIGELPYGTYYLKETAAPDAVNGEADSSYSGNEGKWFCLIVDDSGAYMSGGYGSGSDDEVNKASALTDAAALKTAS